MHADKECCIMRIGWIIVLCFSFPRYSVATSKCYDFNDTLLKNDFEFPLNNYELSLQHHIFAQRKDVI
ncbi:hypothetical protein T03_16012 [Trichinella britovi]|uniref:Uncharacterized protein n=1 Tax=Trichinella britovi TaxID=45882 RepID=A0A0V1CBF0_TRIBR|nr:hypothetical protein T03_16012 [Trichinella britovi]